MLAALRLQYWPLPISAQRLFVSGSTLMLAVLGLQTTQCPRTDSLPASLMQELSSCGRPGPLHFSHRHSSSLVVPCCLQ